MPRPPRLNLQPGPVPGILQAIAPNGVVWQVLPSPAHRAVSVAIRLRLPANPKWTATCRLIAAMANHGCREFPGMAALSRRLDHLYGSRISAVSSRDGQIQQMVWLFRTALPSAMPDGDRVYREGLELFRSVLIDPVIENGGYEHEAFFAERDQLAMQVKAEIDDKASYTLQRAIQLSYPESSLYALPSNGTLEEIALADPATALMRCRTMLERAHMTVTLFGPVDPAVHLPPVVEVLSKLPRVATKQRLPRNRARPHEESPVRRSERHRTEQAQLALTFTSGINMVHKDWAAQRFANAILGAMNTSRLFTVVREEHGLAYAVGAFPTGQTGVVTLYAGTEGAKLTKARQLMLAEVRRMGRDGITDAEFENARQWLTDGTMAAQDSLAARLDTLCAFEACGRVITAEESVARLKRVTPEQVRAAIASWRPLAEFSVRPT